MFFRARGLLCGSRRLRTCTPKGYADPSRASQGRFDCVVRGGTGSQRDCGSVALLHGFPRGLFVVNQENASLYQRLVVMVADYFVPDCGHIAMVGS